jgi:hypothetical protein
MAMIWIGALLILGGVVYTAIQPMMKGRMSRVRPVSPVRPGNTLEPERPARGFGLHSNWPGLAMIAVGALVLLASAIL